MNNIPPTLNLTAVKALLDEAKTIAKKYKHLTGQPLGITGEVGEVEAAILLSLELAQVRQSGFDAFRRQDDTIQRIQIKSRCLAENPKPGQRIGSIQLEKEWDKVLLVLLNEYLEPTKIYEADRSVISQAIQIPGSKARNERGALTINKFKSIGKLLWERN
ncbi:MAG: hypothetical protein ABSA26_00395 [Thermoguttaceae bacterium]|jgi:hypothetical protein